VIAAASDTLAPQESPTLLRRVLEPVSVWAPWALTTAATLAFIWVLTSGLQQDQPKNSTAAAKIVEKVDCVIESDRWRVHRSPDLNPSESIEISSGLVEIEFRSGARVTLQGPARFTVESPTRGYLHEGALTALVPPSAHGFTIGSPSSDTIDLGTEFGMRVAADGSTETHVLDGEVILKPTLTVDRSETFELKLTSLEAARVRSADGEVTEFAAKPAGFIRLWRDRGQVPDEAVGLPVSRKLVLWLSADREARLDEAGRVVSWGDLLTEENIDDHTAWQVNPDRRPDWVENSIGGRPAVRFRGDSYMITSELATGNNVTIFLVFAYNEQHIREDYSGQIINFNGPPNLVVERWWEGNLRARMYAGWKKGKSLRGCWLQSAPISVGRPIVCMYQYNYDEGRSQLTLNGVTTLEDRASFRASTSSPKILGRNRLTAKRDDYFAGDLAEVLVYDVALANNELSQITDYLMKRYQVPARGLD